jgi:hypothetical protein
MLEFDVATRLVHLAPPFGFKSANDLGAFYVCNDTHKVVVIKILFNLRTASQNSPELTKLAERQLPMTTSASPKSTRKIISMVLLGYSIAHIVVLNKFGVLVHAVYSYLAIFILITVSLIYSWIGFSSEWAPEV